MCILYAMSNIYEMSSINIMSMSVFSIFWQEKNQMDTTQLV